MQTSHDYERMARILRGQTQRIRRLEQERQDEGPVQQLRNIIEDPIYMADDVVFTAHTGDFNWDEFDWDFWEWEA